MTLHVPLTTPRCPYIPLRTPQTLLPIQDSWGIPEDICVCIALYAGRIRS